MDSRGQFLENFAGRAAVGARLAIAVFDLLQHACQADFDELVQIAGGDGEKFHPLEQRIASRPAPPPERAG